MTLADLAAMAATVEGFRRPIRLCRTCGGSGESVHGFDSDPCECEAEPGAEWDNSPAALAMAVLRYARQGNRKLEIDRGDFLMRRGTEWSRAKSEDSDEGIARALLVALLRAHGVEVPT